MNRYLTALSGFLGEKQREVLDRLISSDVIEPSLAALIVSVDSSSTPRPITALPEIGDKISSVTYNEFMEAVLVDLTAVYEQNANNFFVVSGIEMKNKDFAASTRAGLLRTKAKLEAIRAIASKRYSAAVHDNFNNTSRIFLDGMKVTDDGLTLSPSKSTIHNTSYDIAAVGKTVYPSEEQMESVKSPDQDVVYNYGEALDGTYKVAQSPYVNRTLLQRGTGSFWRDTFLSKHQVLHYIDGALYDGITVVLQLEFTSPKSINQLLVDPFTEHEMLILKIRWKDVNEVWHDAILDDGSLATGSGTGSISINNISGIEGATAIDIWFAQRNYKLSKYLVGGDLFYQDKVWAEMLYNEYANLEYEFSLDETAGYGPEETGAATTAYQDAITNILAASDISEATRAALNLTPRSDVFLEGYEYTLGAYSIEPIENIYSSGPGIFISHRDKDGYTADINSVTEIELLAEYDEPDTTSVEFYILDEAGKVQVPIVPKGTIHWREHIEPTGDVNIYFETLFPCETGTLVLYKNGTELSTSPVQTEGARTSTFEIPLVYSLPNDVFFVEYDINHTNLTSTTQRRASIVTLEDEITPSIRTDNNRDGTIGGVRGNVITLSAFPYLTTADPSVSLEAFPFYPYLTQDCFFVDSTGQSFPFVSDGFIPYMEVTDEPVANGTWMLSSVKVSPSDPTGTYQLEFMEVGSGTKIHTTEVGPLAVEDTRSLLSEDGTTAYGSVRIDWSTVEEWPDETYTSIYASTDAIGLFLAGETLSVVVWWLIRWKYGKMPLVRSEVMSGVMKGEDLANPLSSLKEEFILTQTPILLAVDNVQAVDKTDYNSPVQQPLSNYEESAVVEFFVSGNKLYTNVDFDVYKSKTIDVFFWYLTPSVKLKMTAWTNRKGDSRFTPTVKNYTLGFRSRS